MPAGDNVLNYWKNQKTYLRQFVGNSVEPNRYWREWNARTPPPSTAQGWTPEFEKERTQWRNRKMFNTEEGKYFKYPPQDWIAQRPHNRY